MGRFKDRKAMLEAIVAEIEAERDPIRMLDERGYTAASGSYTEVKIWAKTHTPELYAKLPQNLRIWKYQHGLGKRRKAAEEAAAAEEAPAVRDTEEAKAAEPEAKPEEPADDPLEDFGMEDALPFDDPEDEPEEAPAPQRQKITRPVNYMGYDVTAIKHPELGEFYYDHKFHCIDWRNEAGDEISLSPQGWKNLIEELPHILRVLGVDV